MSAKGDETTVIVVDDDRATRTLILEILKNEPYRVEVFSSQEAAAEFHRKSGCSAVIYAVSILDESAAAFLDMFRRIDSIVPVIIPGFLDYSAHSELVEHFSADGEVVLVSKPIMPQKFLECVREAIERYRKSHLQIKHYSSVVNDIRAASRMQALLLPDWIVCNNDLFLSSLYEPMYGIGGDLYNLIELGGRRYLIFIGDVAGHGISAAMQMSVVMGWSKTIIEQAADPDNLLPELFNRLNAYFCTEFDHRGYMTCLAVLADCEKETLDYISAGHMGLFRYDEREHRIDYRDPGMKGGIPIGWFQEFEYTAEDVIHETFDRDCRYFSMTDGVMDTCDINSNKMSREEFVKLLVESNVDISQGQIPYLLAECIEEAGYTETSDDVSIISFGRRDSTSAAVKLSAAYTVDMANSKTFSEELHRALKGAGVDEFKLLEIELASVEFFNNIIMHGFATRPRIRPKIMVSVALENGRVEVTFLDRARKFEIELPKPEEGGGFDDFLMDAEAGRGLQLIANLSDGFFRRNYHGLNVSKLYFDLQKGGK
ncbi:SpoIIE family protein phosphatase [Victivallis vadensis]|uniref:ATP-binding SpoIIE family protein phosphatase n=1 Tax=Victivallis vadensis TaxID=172901 RepID=UPI00266B98F1|nr:SpoIIE family protein phosphatase [Victivallis vadensis]